MWVVGRVRFFGLWRGERPAPRLSGSIDPEMFSAGRSGAQGQHITFEAGFLDGGVGIVAPFDVVASSLVLQKKSRASLSGACWEARGARRPGGVCA